MVSRRQEVTVQPVQESHERLQCHSAFDDFLVRRLRPLRHGLANCHCHWHAVTEENISTNKTGTLGGMDL